MANSETPLAGLRCLVLDDELLIALDIQQILEAAGAVVICTGNAAAALEALDRESSVDLAVIDVMLRDNIGNGLNVAAALLERKIPFVFLTGMRAQDMQHATRYPQAPVVEKPYQTAVLLKAIARALAGKART